ncbi:hypothetical protein MBLNU230_g3811t1 [Neophaeotheca triangularis]
MLSRPPTKLTLTPDDITAYEERKIARDAMRDQQRAQQQTHVTSSQDSNQSTVENGGDEDVEMTPAEQSRVARLRAKREREMRIGVGAGPRG